MGDRGIPIPPPPQEWDDFCSPSYKLETTNAASSVMVNRYCEIIEKGPRTGKLRLRQIPGLKAFGAALPDSPLRGMLEIDGGERLFVVAGSTVFEIFGDGTHQALTGNVALNSHPALMVATGFQIAIASGGQLYIADGGVPAGVVNPVNFADGSGPVQAATVDFLDEYLLANVLPRVLPDGTSISGRSVFISNLAPDNAIWDPGDVKIKEGYPDDVARVYCDNEYAYIHGFDTFEAWVNTGGLFPFDRVQNAVLKFGLSAPYSLAGVKGIRFWLWNGVVYAANSTDAQRVSDYGVEEAIKTYGDTSDAEGWCYVSGGHTFYVLSFPTVGKTWVYDTATAAGPVGPIPLKAWHERGLWKNGKYQQYRARVYARAFNKDLVGDSQTGQIWELDPKTYTDADGLPLRKQRTCPYITQQNRNFRYDQLILDMDTGVGLPVAPGQPGYDPQVIMRYSKTRGKVWSNERQASLGRLGEDETRVIFNQNGSSRIGMVFEVTDSDPVPTPINGAYLSIGPPMEGR